MGLDWDYKPPEFKRFKAGFIADMRFGPAHRRLLPELKLYLKPGKRNQDNPRDYHLSAWRGGIFLAAYILRNRKDFKGKRVLDLGTGSGILAIAARLAGAEVTGLDHNLEAIYAARINAEANGVSIKTVTRDCTKYKNYGKFDIIVTADTVYSDVVRGKLAEVLDKYGITVYVASDRYHAWKNVYDLEKEEYNIVRPGVTFERIPTGMRGVSAVKITSHHPIRPADKKARDARKAAALRG